jgi:hypothetical protein
MAAVRQSDDDASLGTNVLFTTFGSHKGLVGLDTGHSCKLLPASRKNPYKRFFQNLPDYTEVIFQKTGIFSKNCHLLGYSVV